MALTPDKPNDQINYYLRDLRYEPPAMRRSWLEDFNMYEGDQQTRQQRAVIKTLGLPDVTINLLAASVDALVGAEISERLAWQLIPKGTDYIDEVAALSQYVNETIVEAGGLQARTAATKNMYQVGCGWVSLFDNREEFMSPDVMAESPKVWDTFYDMRGAENGFNAGLTGSKWWMHRAFFDVAEIREMFKLSADDPILKTLMGYADNQFEDIHPDLGPDSGPQSPTEIRNQMYCASDRSRPAVACVYVREYEYGRVIRMREGYEEIFNINNPVHYIAMVDGSPILRRRIPVIYREYYIAGMRATRDRMPELQGMFPAALFAGMRKVNGELYGMIRNATMPQRRYNDAVQTIIDSANRMRITVDESLLGEDETDDQVIARARQRVSVWRTQTGGRQALSNLIDFQETDRQRIQIAQTELERAEYEISRITGVNAAFLGQTAASQRSARLAEGQAAAVLRTKGEYFDNYVQGTNQMAKLALAHILHTTDTRALNIRLRRVYGATKQTVELNTTARNSVQAVLRHATIDAAPNGSENTNQQRQARMQALLETVGASGGAEVSALLVAGILEAEMTPDGQRIADELKSRVGLPPPESDPKFAEWQAQQKAQAEAQAAAQKAETDKTAAETDKLGAEAEKARADADAIAAREENAQFRAARKKQRDIDNAKLQVAQKRLNRLKGEPAAQTQ
ncbi:MAG: hypothetical protein AAF417_15045 [Pseudomonadota bacterium]